MWLFLLNELLKLLIVVTIFWSVFNLYSAIYWRVRSIKSRQVFAIYKARMKDFFEGFVFLFIFWSCIVLQVYLYGLGVLDSGLHQGDNSVCVGIRFETFCLGKEETLRIEQNSKFIFIDEESE